MREQPAVVAESAALCRPCRRQITQPHAERWAGSRERERETETERCGVLRRRDGSRSGLSPVPMHFAEPRFVATCAQCPAGSASAAQGAVSESTCSVCPPGFWSSRGSSECTPCRAGTSSARSNATSPSECVQCPAGSWSTDGSSECTLCAAGTYSGARAATSIEACTPCPARARSARGLVRSHSQTAPPARQARGRAWRAPTRVPRAGRARRALRARWLECPGSHCALNAPAARSLLRRAARLARPAQAASTPSTRRSARHAALAWSWHSPVGRATWRAWLASGRPMSSCSACRALRAGGLHAVRAGHVLGAHGRDAVRPVPSGHVQQFERHLPVHFVSGDALHGGSGLAQPDGLHLRRRQDAGRVRVRRLRAGRHVRGGRLRGDPRSRLLTGRRLEAAVRGVRPSIGLQGRRGAQLHRG